jgi:glucose 1-dehydrogenase
VNRFEDRVALITGAARGIGRGIALQFAHEGAKVVVNDYANMELAEELVREIERDGGDALACQADVSDRDAVVEMVAASVARFGRLDIAVANAAVSVREPVVSAEWGNVKRTIEVSQLGVFLVCQAAVKQMCRQERSGRSRGKIVITGSIQGEHPFPQSAPYNMAKAAVNHFGRTLAAELTTERINVNVINPGWIDTPGERLYSSEEEIEAAAPRLPWGRLGTPGDIAMAAAFLASDDADYITGAALRVDGGYMASLSLPQMRRSDDS